MNNNLINLTTLLPLQVILPLIFAVTLLFFKNKHKSNILTIAFLSCNFFISLSFVIFTNYKSSHVTYLFGSFSTSIGIEYAASKLSSLIMSLISLLALINFSWGIALTKKEVGSHKVYIFNTLYIVFYTGLLGIVATNDLFNIFIFLEISAISSYALITINNKVKEAPLAALNYLIIGSIAASLYILGVGIIYMFTGNLNISVVSNLLNQTDFTPTFIIAIISILLFWLIKGGIFPFSFWLPSVYNAAPFTFTTFLSGTSSKIILFAFFKIIIIILSIKGFTGYIIVKNILVLFAIISTILGSILAITQKNIKRLLGWSSVAYLGYILLALILFDKKGLVAAILLIITHSFTKTGLFMVAGNINYLTNSNDLSNLSGFRYQSRFNFLAFIIFSLSFIGFPLTIGFTAKWYLIVELINHHYIFASIAVLFSSVLAIIYLWKIIEVMQFSTPNTTLNEISEQPLMKSPLYMNIIVAILLIINIGMGLCSGIITNYLNHIINY
ncbi:complex I subunit 5 family protein [Rickettsiales bacterium LUAb2]